MPYGTLQTQSALAELDRVYEGESTSSQSNLFPVEIHRYFDIVSKYNVGLKTLPLQGLSEREFHGDLVYKFKKSIGQNRFSLSFQKDNCSL